MEFDEVVVKESPGLCRCCLSEGCYKDLGSEYSWMGDTEIYADMLLECFDIGVSQHAEGPNGPNRLICEVCITRLRDACNFKKQVLDSEKRFIDMLHRGDFKSKGLVFPSDMKQEAEALDVEYLDDLDFGDDAEDLLKTDTEAEPSQSEDITVASLPPVKRGRGRPRKSAATPVKPERRAKMAKLEDKPRSSKAAAKGDTALAERNHKAGQAVKIEPAVPAQTELWLPIRTNKTGQLIETVTEPVGKLLKVEHTVPPVQGPRIRKVADHGFEKLRKVWLPIINKTGQPIETVTAPVKSEHTGQQLWLPIINQTGQPIENVITVENEALKLQNTGRESEKVSPKMKQRTKHIKPNSKPSSHPTREVFDDSLIRQNIITILEFSTVIPFKYRHKYICFYCNNGFSDATLLRDHTLDDHRTPIRHDWKLKSYYQYIMVDVTEIQCRLCQVQIEKLDSLIQHLKSQHNKQFIEEIGYGVIPYKVREDELKCAICDAKFEYFAHLNQHMNSHYENFVCETCGKGFLNVQRLKTHMHLHFTQYPCKECTDTFTSVQERTQHVRRVHNTMRSLKCHKCDRMFHSYYLRMMHYRTKHPTTPTIDCPVCQKKFIYKSVMKSHLRNVHEKQMNHPCSLCGLKFNTSSDLRKHYLSIKHLGERKYTCDYCNKAYARKHRLAYHIRTHTTQGS